MALEDSPVHVPSLPPQQLVICHTETQGDTRKHKSWTRGDAHLKILASDILMLLSYQSSSLFCRILLLKAVSRLKMIIVQEKKREKRIFCIYFFFFVDPTSLSYNIHQLHSIFRNIVERRYSIQVLLQCILICCIFYLILIYFINVIHLILTYYFIHIIGEQILVSNITI